MKVVRQVFCWMAKKMMCLTDEKAEDKIVDAAPFYPGVEILRLLGAMAVVWAHYGKFRMPVVKFAVPCFVVISFFLGWRMVESGEFARLGRRLSRLAVPFFAWGCVSYIVAVASGAKTGLAPLLWQLSLGHSTCMPLYYLFDMAVMMVVLFVVRRCFPVQVFWCIVGFLALACMCMQYSELNYELFGQLPVEASFPLGRIVELFPSAVAGCVIATGVLCGRRSFTVGVALSVVAVVTLLCEFLVVGKQFGYAGFALLIGPIGFVLMSTAFTSRNPMLRRVRIVSAATAGVYFIHTIVGDVLHLFKARNYWSVLLISFAITMIGLRIPVVCNAFNGRARKQPAGAEALADNDCKSE